MTDLEIVRELRELIAALNRRTPYVERAGEAAIARDAASLKARALKRIEALELEAASGEIAATAGSTPYRIDLSLAKFEAPRRWRE